MYLRYNGVTENFKYKGFDFSDGPCEVPDAIAVAMVKENPRTFTPVVKAEDVDFGTEGTDDNSGTEGTDNKSKDPAKVTPIKKTEPKK